MEILQFSKKWKQDAMTCPETEYFFAHKAICRVNATEKDSMCMQAYQQDVFDVTHTLYSNCKEKQHGCIL
jgi:hypothetical protein